MLERKDSKNKSNFIFASLLTGVYDVNRNELLKKNDFGIVKKWYNSIVNLQLNGIIFHNTFSKEIVEKYTNKYIKFIKVEYDESLNPNVFRYFIYQDYLRKNETKISNLFVTDISDVEVISDPFQSHVFLEKPDFLFCGDETEILDNEWMRNHCSHLRNSMPEFGVYEAQQKNETLINCGVIGGKLSVMKSLLDKMVDMHKVLSYSNTTAYTLDMGVFNFIARTGFAHKIIHGEPVNTVFKKYESQRTDCWFRHK